MKMLSVIVPVYNVEQYIEECVESLLVQTYQKLEIILVDDGSTDKSGIICDGFALQHPNIIVIHQKNQGLPGARNSGLKIATGEYVGFVDSDDIIKRDMYEKLISTMEKTNADLSCCNFEIFNRKGLRAVSKNYNDETVEFQQGREKDFFRSALDSSCNKLFRSEIIKKHFLTFEDKKIVAQEDFWFNVRYCANISKISSISDALYRYRQRASSITKSGQDHEITSRCIRFIQLSGSFISDKNINAVPFLEHLTLEMMFASINQTPYCTPRGIRSIVEAFKNTDNYVGAISKTDGFEEGIKGYYDRFKLSLLRHNANRLFSWFECIRVMRLRGRKNTSDHFA